MSIGIDALKEVVINPLYGLKYYHGDAQADLLELLENYNDADKLTEQLDDAKCTIDSLNDDIRELNDNIRDLEKQIEDLKK